MRFLTVAVLLVLMRDTLAGAQDVRVLWRDRPSVRIGNNVRVDVRARFQVDLRHLSPDVPTDEGAFDVQRLRFAVDGTVFDDLEYQVEREFRETFSGRRVSHPWRDVYVNYQRLDDFQFQAGKFKIPFSQEQLTSSSNLDFVNRSLLAEALAPGRDVGIVVHGRFFNRGIGYEVGLFRGDGENSEASGTRGGRTWVLRLQGSPFRLLALTRAIQDAVLGAAFMTSDVPESLTGLRGRTYSGDTFFSHVQVKGPRRRLSFEGQWMHGPFGFNAEFIQTRETRYGQSIQVEDLAPVISQGWYVSASWVLSGESKEDGVEPARPFLESGLGALEVAGRFEKLRIGNTRSGEPAFTSPRAPNVLENSDRAITLGLNWYLNRFLRVQANGIVETIEDTNRSPIAGRAHYWTGIARLQFSM